MISPDQDHRFSLSVRLAHAAKLLTKRIGLGPPLRRLRSRHPWDPALSIGRTRGWSAAAQWLLGPGRPHLAAGDRQHLRELATDFVVDAERELLLGELRRALLSTDIDLFADESLCAVVEALIRQCDLNEHVFLVSDEEKRLLSGRPLDPLALAAGQRDAAQDLVRHAMYASPRVLVGTLDPALRFETILPGALAAIMSEARASLDAEGHFAARIPRHGEIVDTISQKVAAQYEENPYPSWATLQVQAGARLGHLRAHFEEEDLSFLKAPFNVLIAGCATGRQAIRCGLGYGAQASVLAIDLSRASLAYAARMASTLGASNVKFLQADIDSVGSMGRQFDIIECTGVLHHMADPVAGWAQLAQALKPGGLMYIGLYSQAARRIVNRCRAEIREQGLTGSAEDIRRYRRQLLERFDPQRLWLREQYFPFCRDFFTTSNCRDLLFHVNEHQFTIPQIASCLRQFGLDFHGFAVQALPGDRLWSRFPARTDLGAWERFEQRNPETFVQMYEFWCRKPLSPGQPSV